MGTGYVLCLGDKTTCGGQIISGNPDRRAHSRPIARHGDIVTCGKHDGQYKIIGGISFMTDVEGASRRAIAGTLDSVSSCPCRSSFIVTKYPAMTYENERRGAVSNMGAFGTQKAAAAAASSIVTSAFTASVVPVFAKSRMRGSGDTDAGEHPEPHTNFASMAFYQTVPSADPASDNDVVQHAQAVKKKNPVEDIPKPKKRNALYKWWFGNHEETEYQRATTAATSAANAQTAVEGASVFGLIGGSAITSGTWAVKFGEMATGLGRVAASGPGAPIAAVVMGMMPGRLNDGEQDFIDRMRLEQMREAPSRVRYTWEQDDKGHPVPHGWHTPPGKDMVRVRKMEWDSFRKAYTFTTEEDPRITIIWTPDNTGENRPRDTGNQNPVSIPNPVIVDPLPENTGIETTTSPSPEEKNFADYILILPLANIPPIYIYLNADHKYHAAPKGNPPLPAFPDAKVAKKRTSVKGGGSLRSRWKDPKGRIYEWDSQHGTVEIYDRSGRNHLGEFDPVTGEQTKSADPTRKVEK